MLFPFFNGSRYKISITFILTWVSAGGCMSLSRQIGLIILNTLGQLKHPVNQNFGSRGLFNLVCKGGHHAMAKSWGKVLLDKTVEQDWITNAHFQGMYHLPICHSFKSPLATCSSLLPSWSWGWRMGSSSSLGVPPQAPVGWAGADPTAVAKVAVPLVLPRPASTLCAATC